MKKIVPFIQFVLSVIFMGGMSIAQESIHSKANTAIPAPIHIFDGTEVLLPLNTINPTVAPYPARLSATQTVIGSTYYDLQTNASSDDRMVRYGNNELSATWTFGLNFPAFPDRGTGYNYFDGSNWQNTPSNRVEYRRTGWPSIAVTASGKEHLISHTAGDDSLVYSYRPVAGSGSWFFNAFPPMPSGNYTLWPRLASGGTNGNSLHMISITTPVANAGQLYQGIDGALVYSRSQDDGVTWDKLYELLPTIDSTLYFAMGADAYSIHARGNTIAIVTGSYLTDWALWKSTDNGDTWTKTVINQFPFPAYNPDGFITDLNSDGVADTISTTDGKVAVLIDHNNTVHTWAGAMRIIDSDVAGTGFFFFPFTDALLYWNESFGAGTAPDTIAWALDLDGDGVITLAPDGIPAYRGGITTQASAGIDALENIYVGYQSVVENTSAGADPPGTLNDFSYRNAYLIASPDGGVTWNNPVNVTNDDFFEGVYPSVPKDVRTDCVDIIWQQDYRPDIASVPAAGNPLHPFATSNINLIMHECVSTQLLLGINENVKSISDILVYPNPATEHVKVNYTIKEPTEMKVEFRNTLGQVLMIQNYKAIAPGLHSLDMDVSSLPAGIYFINTIVDGQNISAKLIIQ